VVINLTTHSSRAVRWKKIETHLSFISCLESIRRKEKYDNDLSFYSHVLERERKRGRGEEGTGKMVDSCFFFLLSISILPK
jgi:hypothetical protein